MRKITSLLVLFCMCISAAFAQPWTRPVVSTGETVYEYYIQNARNSDYYVTTTNGLNGGAQQLGSANSFTDANKAKVTFKLTEGGKLYSTNTTTQLVVGYTTTDGAANSVQLFKSDNNYTWNVEAANVGVTLSAGNSSNSWNMHGGAGQNIGLYGKTDGGSNWIFVPANDAAEAKAAEVKAAYAFSTEYFYQFQNVAYSRMLSSNENMATVTSTNSTADLYQLWKIETASEGKYYLKNAGSGKYLNYSESNDTPWKVSETPQEFSFKVVKDLTNENPAAYAIQYNETDDITCAHDANWGGTYEQVVRWYSTANASQWYAIKTNISVNSLPISLTYSFTYGGVEKYTQECTGYVDEDYPDVTVDLPFGVAATKPSGKLTSDVDGTTITIELKDNTPFVAAADYASIKNWYYLKNKGEFYLSHVTNQDHIALGNAQKNVDVNNKDAYTWAFVGNPFDGFQLVNKTAGEGYVLSSSTTIEGDGANTFPVMVKTPIANGSNELWVLTSSSHQTNGFFIAQKGFANNRMNNRGNKLAYWTGGADNGSTFTVEERDMTGATELQALIVQVEALVATGVANGTTVGYITSESATVVATALDAAKTAVANKTGCDAAQAALQAAVDGAQTIQPEEGKFYKIVSACTKDHRAGQDVYVNNTGSMHFAKAEHKNLATDFARVWQFIPATDGKFYIKNVERGVFMQSVGNATETNVDNAKAVTITNMGMENRVSIKPDGQSQMHAQDSNSKILGWNENNPTDGSAWKIEEVDINTINREVTVGAAGYSTLVLGYNAEIPADVEVYTVSNIGSDYVTLSEVTGILPAGEAVVLKNEGTYYFNYTAEEATKDKGNLLEGTVFNTYITGTAYVLSKPEGSEVGLYKAALNKTATGAAPEEGQQGTHFLNNAFKAYLLLPTGGNVNALRFNFDGETTAIETVETENANAPIYDLSGRRVLSTVKGGVYIQNGKKFIVK